MQQRDRVVEQLVAELGRAASDIYSADREAPDSPELARAHVYIAEASELIAELVRDCDDVATVARAWEAIAGAQDAACRARNVGAAARAQFVHVRAVRGQVRAQGARAHAQAARITRWWANLFRRRSTDLTQRRGS